jgi:hypothetical protein
MPSESVNETRQRELPYIEYTAILAFYWPCWPGKTGGGTPLFLKWRGGEQQEPMP